MTILPMLPSSLPYVANRYAVSGTIVVCKVKVYAHHPTSFMQYGLGEDISEFIRVNPEVSDLLISLTAAAAKGENVKRFNPFPQGLEVTGRWLSRLLLLAGHRS